MTQKDNQSKPMLETFILRSEFYLQIKLLNRVQRGDLLTAIFAYVRNEELPELDNATAMCFEFIRVKIDYYAGKYEKICAQNRENGKKGGRPQKDKKRSGKTETDSSRMLATESEITGRFCKGPKESENGDGLAEKPVEKNETERFEKNHYPYPYPYQDNTHTHTVDTKEGGVGETKQQAVSDEVARMLEWIADRFPAFQKMPEPFNETQISWMLGKYEPDDIRRIIAAMDNKGAAKNKSAFATFSSFAGSDRIIKEKREAMKAKFFTYEEMCNEIPARAKSTADFECVIVENRKMWRRK